MADEKQRLDEESRPDDKPCIDEDPETVSGEELPDPWEKGGAWNRGVDRRSES
jgi:hypothetical protein